MFLVPFWALNMVVVWRVRKLSDFIKNILCSEDPSYGLKQHERIINDIIVIFG